MEVTITTNGPVWEIPIKYLNGNKGRLVIDDNYSNEQIFERIINLQDSLNEESPNRSNKIDMAALRKELGITKHSKINYEKEVYDASMILSMNNKILIMSWG